MHPDFSIKPVSSRGTSIGAGHSLGSKHQDIDHSGSAGIA
jgi:hypothetical protein